MKKTGIPLIVFLLTTLFGCSTFQNDQNSSAAVHENPVMKTDGYGSVQMAFSEFENLMKSFDTETPAIPRDIDDREWIMTYINQHADRDMLMVRIIYENLKYRNWSEEEKAEFLQRYYYVEDGTAGGQLIETRESVWDEISYLLRNSRLLVDSPWLVRDFYDSRSEYSYWYLLYLARLYYPFWIEDSILPALLALIPEDRVNGVTYLWLKSPDSLCSMKNEIIATGYPWNRILEMMDMNDYIRDQIAILNSDGKMNEEEIRACLF